MNKFALLAATPLLLMGLSACDKKPENTDTATPAAEAPATIAPATMPQTPTAPVVETPAAEPATTEEVAPAAPTDETAPEAGTVDDGAQRAAPGQVPSAAQPNEDTPVKEKN